MNKRTPLDPRVKAINIGVELFAEALRAQNVETIHLQWRPYAAGNKQLQPILEKLTRTQSSRAIGRNLVEKIDKANNKAISNMLAADPRWVDMKPAIEALPGMKKNLILKSGR